MSRPDTAEEEEEKREIEQDEHDEESRIHTAIGDDDDKENIKKPNIHSTAATTSRKRRIDSDFLDDVEKSMSLPRIDALIVSQIEHNRVQRLQQLRASGMSIDCGISGIKAESEQQLPTIPNEQKNGKNNSNNNKTGIQKDYNKLSEKLARHTAIPGTVVSPIDLRRGRNILGRPHNSLPTASVLQAPAFIRRLQTHLSLPGAVAVPGINSDNNSSPRTRLEPPGTTSATRSTPPVSPRSPSGRIRTSTTSDTEASDFHDDILVSATIVQDDPTTAWWFAEAKPAGKHRWKWMLLVAFLVILLVFCVTIIYMQGRSFSNAQVFTPPRQFNGDDGTNDASPGGDKFPDNPSFGGDGVTTGRTESPFVRSAAPSPVLAWTDIPSQSPTKFHSSTPSQMPSWTPSSMPSTPVPSAVPTTVPSFSPSGSPSDVPSSTPTSTPTVSRSWTRVGQEVDGLNAGESFGQSVAIATDHGDVVAVGAHLADNNGFNSGVVRVIALVEDRWGQLGQTLVGSTSYDQAGWAVDLSADGSILAVGGWTGGFLLEGIVQIFVYSNNDNRWYQLGQDLYGATPAMAFGTSVSLSDDGLTVAVGADFGTDGQAFTGSATVYRYSRFTARWEPIGEPVTGTKANDRFGWDVSLSGDGLVLAVGDFLAWRLQAGQVKYSPLRVHTSVVSFEKRTMSKKR